MCQGDELSRMEEGAASVPSPPTVRASSDRSATGDLVLRVDEEDRAAAPVPPRGGRAGRRPHADGEGDHDRAATPVPPRGGRAGRRRHADGGGDHDRTATPGPPPHADFGSFYLQIMTSCGNNFNDFPEFVQSKEIVTKTEKTSFSLPWLWAYFLMGLNAVASIAPSVIPRWTH